MATGRRFHLIAAFVLSTVAFGLLRSALGVSSVQALSVMLARGSFIPFTFFMITDPKTSPHTACGRVAYGVAVAVIDALFRIMDVPYSLFLALVVVCAIYGIYRFCYGDGPAESLWQTASAGGATTR